VSAPPKLKRISIDDFSGLDENIRGGIDKLLQMLNPFLSDVAGALQGRLTFSENLAVVTKTVEFAVPSGTTPWATVVVACEGLPAKPVHVIVTRCEDITSKTTSIPALTPAIAWEYGEYGGKPVIRITNQSGLTAGNRYRLTLLISV
jgi:hypothetical protein